jgi:hypothetical protein
VVASPEGDRLRAVRGYAADAVGCSPDRITAVSRFEDGNRHAVYRVAYLDAAGAGENLVIRVSYGGEPADCEQAEREARVLKQAGGSAGPVLYDFRCTSRWFDTPTMCMQFLPGRQRDLGAVGAAEMSRLGSVVAWIHDQPVQDFADGTRSPAPSFPVRRSGWSRPCPRWPGLAIRFPARSKLA